MSETRTGNSIRNITVALIGQSVGIILQFISRRVFVDSMPMDLLGINSVFANILSMLSLAELGIGSAITFSLYKPLAENDTHQITAIMNFYKWMYRMIAIVVTICGICFVPFLRIIIKDDIKNLTIYYFLYLSSTVISYLCAYKRTLIIADQKGYISSIYRYSYIAILSIIQIVVLLVFHSYVLYLVSQIILSFGENLLITRKADQLYPYLNDTSVKLSDKDKKGYFKNIRAMLMHRIGSVIVTNTDSILLSALVNINAVSIYANYKLVFSGLSTIMSQLFSSVTASVGNLLQEKNTNHAYDMYKIIEIMTCWIYGVVSICLMVLFNDFIGLWVGEQFIESQDYVFILIGVFFIYGIREPTNMFKNALGLFWNDRYKAVAEAIVNIVLSIIMGKLWRERGIFGATIISAIMIPCWIEPYVLYKHHWKRKVSEYFALIGKQIGVLFFIGFVLTYGFSFIDVSSWIGFILKSAICFVTANLLYVLSICRTNEFNQIVKIGRGFATRCLAKSNR